MAKSWTVEELIEVAKSCQSRRVMREKHSAALLQIYRKGIADVAFAHMDKERQYASDCVYDKKCTSCGERKTLDQFYKASGSSRRPSCKSCCDANSSAWRKNNPERSREIVNNSSKKDPQKVRDRANEKRKNNPHVASARDMLKRVLSITGKKKTTRTEAALGYTCDDLKAHIAAQFKDGMSWDNHGEWHIDHIEPVSDMVKRGVTDPSVINALSNLRPLWAYENLSRKRV